MLGLILSVVWGLEEIVMMADRDSGVIVMDGMNRNHCRVVLNLLWKDVRQSRESPHAHMHRQIVSFDIRRADMLGIRISARGFHIAAATLSSAISN